MPESAAPTRHSPFDSLATRVISVVFLGTFLAAATVSWISVEASFTFLRHQNDIQLPAEAQRLAEALDRWLEEARADLATQAVGPALAGRLRAGSSPEELKRRLNEGLSGSTFFEGLAIVDARGARLAAAGTALRLLPESGLALPPASVEIGQGRALPAVAVPLPVPGANRPDLVLVGVVHREALGAQLVANHSTDPDDIRLVAPDGRTVRALRGGSLSRRSPRPEPTPRPTAIDRGPDGVFVVGAGRALESTGCWLLVERPFRVAFAPVLAVVTRIFVIDVFILLVFSFLAYQVTAAIVRPIEALSEGARLISQGQLDVAIPEPRGHDEVGLLTRTFNDMTRMLVSGQVEIREANARLQTQNEELQSANEVLEQLSITDGLTKLHNHRFFQDFLTREIKRVSRTNEPLSILLLDIDDFKLLNDRLGHAAGDELLVATARLLNGAVRETDLVARYGGEEFVVLAPGTDLEGATRLAEKVRTEVAESALILDDTMQLTKMTVSIGVAQFSGSRKAFFQGADQALYRAKAAGKNCVVVDGADSSIEPGEIPGP